MARIPDVEIERLKGETDLVALVESSGIELKKRGGDLVGRCPFHDDKTPLLVVTPKKNLWHCLGACEAGGSVIDWVMKRDGVSFRHAVELLKDGHARGAPTTAADSAVHRHQAAAPVADAGRGRASCSGGRGLLPRDPEAEP